MTRYVITPRIAIRLAEEEARVADATKLLAPTLLRSQVLSILYQRVRDGELDRSGASEYLDFIRALKIRLLGDRVLQKVAWKIADELDLTDTFDAEYVALTKLQADALVADDGEIGPFAATLVPLAAFGDLVR